MAIHYTDIATAQNAAASNLADLNETGALVSGCLLVHRSRYTLLGSETASDFVRVAKLPKGARLIPHLCNVACDAAGTALTFNLGDTADVDRYASALDVTAGGSFDLDELLTAPKAGYTIGSHADDDGWITVDVASVDTLTAGAVLVFTLIYVLT